MPNINDTYFQGYYKDIWKSIIPPELTAKEIDFMISYFDLSEESRVLDLMCGFGRHAIGLARKGISVTAVDNLNEYTREIKATVSAENLPVTVITEDILSFDVDGNFDLAICMGNSLNFFAREDLEVLLRRINKLVSPQGTLLINSWSIAEIATKNFTSKSWSSIGDLKFLTASEFLFQPTRIEFTTTVVSSEGIVEEKSGVDFIYSIAEMESMLRASGFFISELFSIPGKKKFAVGEPRLYLLANKT